MSKVDFPLPVFLITAAILVTGALIWMFLINPEVPVVEGRTLGVKNAIPGWIGVKQ